MAQTQPRGDYSLRILGALVHGIEARLGEAGLEAIAAAGGVSVAELHIGQAWVSTACIESMLAKAARLLDDNEVLFLETCIAGMPRAYGFLKYVLWATTPERVFGVAMRTAHLVSSVGRWQPVESRSNKVRARFVSERVESRWLCLIRQANIAGLPTLWGLPRPTFVEHKCMARGDTCCDYEAWWPVRRAWLGPLLAGAACGGAALALASVGALASRHVPLIALLGGGLLSYLDLMRTGRQNQEVAQRSVEALQQLAEAERRARLEALDLATRQRDFVATLDQQIAQRTRVLEQSLLSVQQLHQVQTVQMQGAAHDLRNPLAAITANAEILREVEHHLPPAHQGIARDLADAAQRLRRMADELVRLLRQEVQHDALALAPLVVSQLAQTLERRLAALVRNPEVHVTVMTTREAPDLIEVDTVRLDRVLDNLLGNAVKYTKSGSILVELTGTPDSLVIKIGDSGRGISAEGFSRVFKAGGSLPEERAPASDGLGLSVVVRLLAEMGGRLEVLSIPTIGTTFWIYMPWHPPAVEQPREVVKETEDDLMAKVVTIRRHVSGA